MSSYTKRLSKKIKETNNVEPSVYSEWMRKAQEIVSYYEENSKSEWVVITPDLANFYLTYCNEKNRQLNTGTVNSYTNQIKGGKWEPNGENVIFGQEREFDLTGASQITLDFLRDNGFRVYVGEDGQPKVIARPLLNGQHRFNAIVKSGFPLPMNVTYGIKEEAFGSMDTGKVRQGKDAISASHIFSEYGIKGKSISIISAAVKKVLEYRSGRKGSHGSSSTRTTAGNQEIINEADYNKELYVSIMRKYNEWKKTIKVENWFDSSMSKKLNVGFMAWLVGDCGWSEGDVFLFFSQLVDKRYNSGNDETDPIERLKENVTTFFNVDKGKPKPYTDINMFDFYARAWNAYMEKKPLKKMSRRQECADFLTKEEYEAKKRRNRKVEVSTVNIYKTEPVIVTV